MNGRFSPKCHIKMQQIPNEKRTEKREDEFLLDSNIRSEMIASSREDKEVDHSDEEADVG